MQKISKIQRSFRFHDWQCIYKILSIRGNRNVLIDQGQIRGKIPLQSSCTNMSVPVCVPVCLRLCMCTSLSMPVFVPFWPCLCNIPQRLFYWKNGVNIFIICVRCSRTCFDVSMYSGFNFVILGFISQNLVRDEMKKALFCHFHVEIRLHFAWTPRRRSHDFHLQCTLCQNVWVGEFGCECGFSCLFVRMRVRVRFRSLRGYGSQDLDGL